MVSMLSSVVIVKWMSDTQKKQIPYILPQTHTPHKQQNKYPTLYCTTSGEKASNSDTDTDIQTHSQHFYYQKNGNESFINIIANWWTHTQKKERKTTQKKTPTSGFVSKSYFIFLLCFEPKIFFLNFSKKKFINKKSM